MSNPLEPPRQIAGEPSPPAYGDRVIANREGAGNALRDLFLVNAAGGDYVANDQLVDALVRRLRVLRASGDGTA